MVNKEIIEKEKEFEDEKSLEELLVEKNYKINPLILDRMIKEVMILKKYESESAGREFLKQKLNNDEDITKFRHNNSVTIQKNYNNIVLKNLKNLMESEKKSYDELMGPFRDKKNLENNMTFAEKTELYFYKLSGKADKVGEFKERIDDQLMLRSFYNAKEGLTDRLDSSKGLKTKNEEIIDKGRTLIEDSTDNLRAILDTLKAGKKSVIKLKSEKGEILEDLSKEEYNQSTGLYNKKRDQVSKLSRDINRIHEEGLISLEDAEDLEAEIIEYTKDVNEKNQLKNFYKNLARIYTRRIKIISNIIIKINEGLSFKVAYEEAKAFTKNDNAFTIYEKIKKDQYSKHNEEFFSFKVPHRENELQVINHGKKDMDYNVLISEGINKIGSFLSKIPQTYK